MNKSDLGAQVRQRHELISEAKTADAKRKSEIAVDLLENPAVNLQAALTIAIAGLTEAILSLSEKERDDGTSTEETGASTGSQEGHQTGTSETDPTGTPKLPQDQDVPSGN